MEASARLSTAFLRRADEGTLSRLLVEASILLAASRGNPTTVLKEAATAYKVDTEAIASKVQAGVRREGQGEEGTASQLPKRQESGLDAISQRGGEPAASRFLSAPKSRRENPLLVSPCTLIPPDPAPARRLRGRRRSSSCTFPSEPLMPEATSYACPRSANF